MMEILKAVVLGVVEGVTEFLPVSSTGHLILVNQFVSFGENFTKMFDIIIQLGAILAVVVIFWDKLFPWGSAKNQDARKETFELWKKSIVGVFPALVVAGLFHDKIEKYLFSPYVVAVSLVLGGVAIIAVERRTHRETVSTLSALSFRTAFLVGVFQCLAMIPGTSRSAATIVGGLLLGCSRPVAAEFSFFLAIPLMAAATGYSLLKVGFTMSGTEAGALAVGFLVSFLTAWAVVRGFLNYIKRKNFAAFGWYRIVLGASVLGYFILN